MLVDSTTPLIRSQEDTLVSLEGFGLGVEVHPSNSFPNDDPASTFEFMTEGHDCLSILFTKLLGSLNFNDILHKTSFEELGNLLPLPVGENYASSAVCTCRTARHRGDIPAQCHDGRFNAHG
jgi:hypothetical protein